MILCHSFAQNRWSAAYTLQERQLHIAVPAQRVPFAECCVPGAGMLSRIVRLRRQLWAAGQGGGQQQQEEGEGEERVYPLKLIIMSATLR